MKSVELSLSIVPDQSGAMADTPYGAVPYGIVQTINLPGQEPLRTSRVKGETVDAVTPLPVDNAIAIYEYWRLYGIDGEGDKMGVYRNCHSFAHIGATLLAPNIPNNNLLAVTQLPLDMRDAAQPPTDPAMLTPGAAYAVTSGGGSDKSSHSMLGLVGTDLILEVNQFGGGLRTRSAIEQAKKWGGTGLQRLTHPSPAIGTDYWLTENPAALNVRTEDIHTDVLTGRLNLQLRTYQF